MINIIAMRENDCHYFSTRVVSILFIKVDLTLNTGIPVWFAKSREWRRVMDRLSPLGQSTNNATSRPERDSLDHLT